MNKQEITAAAGHIGAMLAGFPQTSAKSGKALLESFLEAVKNSRCAAVERTAKRFVQGEVEGASKSFAPSVAEFCVELRAQEAFFTAAGQLGHRKSVAAHNPRERESRRNWARAFGFTESDISTLERDFALWWQGLPDAGQNETESQAWQGFAARKAQGRAYTQPIAAAKAEFAALEQERRFAAETAPKLARPANEDSARWGYCLENGQSYEQLLHFAAKGIKAGSQSAHDWQRKLEAAFAGISGLTIAADLAELLPPQTGAAISYGAWQRMERVIADMESPSLRKACLALYAKMRSAADPEYQPPAQSPAAPRKPRNWGERLAAEAKLAAYEEAATELVGAYQASPSLLASPLMQPQPVREELPL